MLAGDLKLFLPCRLQVTGFIPWAWISWKSLHNRFKTFKIYPLSVVLLELIFHYTISEDNSKHCPALINSGCPKLWKKGERDNTPPLNVPVIPQSQQCFNLLCHLMSHLNVLQPSNMNHEYMHPGVGQHSLLEYITTVPGDHFVHPSKMYHISTVERETWLHVSCDVSIITIHEIQTLMAGPLIWTISCWGEIYSGVKGDHTIKGLGRKTGRDCRR